MYFKQKKSNGEFAIFESDLNFDVDVATKLTDAEIKVYLLQKAKNEKIDELNSYYNSDECWLFKLKSTKLNASLTKSADWFAKMLPACRNKNIQLFSDKSISNFFLSDKGADELNYQINVVASFKIKSLKLEAEKLINNAKSVEEIVLIDVKKALGIVPREIEIDNI
jgi:hypothetical protein